MRRPKVRTMKRRTRRGVTSSRRKIVGSKRRRVSEL